MENEMESDSPQRESPSLESVDDSVAEPYCFESDPVALKNNPQHESPSLESVDDSVGEPYCFELDPVALKNNPQHESPSLESVDDSVGEPYCFESDHVALKNNPDYQRLLRTICILEAQRSKAIVDLEQLYLAQEKVLKDPISFVDRLQRTGNLGIPLPGQQTIAELPVIDWKKYTSSVDFKSFGTHRQSARLKHHASETGEDENLQRLKSSLEEGGEQGEGTALEGFVRGRFKDESKSATFNKLWTPEEQRRLDELLIKFPPEEVEARRWRKIAAAFGDRTPQQIASRVQKYFQKLERNRLPVPGRVPNRVAPRVKKSGQRHHHHHHPYHHHHPHLMRPERDSTFLQRYRAPVVMTEDGDGEDGVLFGMGMGVGEPPSLPSSSSCSSPSSSSYAFHGEGSAAHLAAGGGTLGNERTQAGDLSEDDEDIPEELKHTAEYRELKQLRGLREEKLQTLDTSVALHQGYKCDRCGCGPIVGVRWHCVDCPTTTSLDFCEICYYNLGSFETASHNSSHRVRPVKRTWSKLTQDQDYLNFSNSSSKHKDSASAAAAATAAVSNYNYLDPNYMPAV